MSTPTRPPANTGTSSSSPAGRARHPIHQKADIDLTRLAVTPEVADQLAAHAAAYGWQLVIVQDDRQLPLLQAAEPQRT